MALIVETGTGLADAEVYCPLAFADSYHAARGNTLWATMSETEREASMRRAVDYMQQQYRTHWAGYRLTITQALDWPRYEVPRVDFGGFYATDAVPIEVQRACAELAFRAASGELLGDQGQTVIEQTVGPITTKYADGSSPRKRFAAVDALLGPLLKQGGARSFVPVVRA